LLRFGVLQKLDFVTALLCSVDPSLSQNERCDELRVLVECTLSELAKVLSDVGAA